MKIPDFLSRDDYLQNPIMRRFLKEHKLKFAETRVDYVKAIETYANQSEENEDEVRKWLLKILKEGSKDICYRKIYYIDEMYKNLDVVENKIKEIYPKCPKVDVLSYKNTGNKEMIDYQIIVEDDEVKKVEFTFSKLFLYGKVGTLGDVTIFPVFIEIYMDKGFIISRSKAKSTLFAYDEQNKYLDPDYKKDTMTYAVELLDEIVDGFRFEVERNAKLVKAKNSQMLYKLYEKYSFTPNDVEEKVKSQEGVINQFVNQFFSNLGLQSVNKTTALLDAKILVEKFISINGDNEEIFKKDRSAYLIKVSTDDDAELTKIDTASFKGVPLQCTEIFFDGKKSVMKGKQCKGLHMIFRREDETYFTKANPLVVRLGANKNYGYIKTMQYAEEADIQNVLQAIFENY